MMNKELEQAIEYFKNRNSFSCVVSATPEFKTILKYYQIVYENWQECEREIKELKTEIIGRQETEKSITKWVSELTNELEDYKGGSK